MLDQSTIYWITDTYGIDRAGNTIEIRGTTTRVTTPEGDQAENIDGKVARNLAVQKYFKRMQNRNEQAEKQSELTLAQAAATVMEGKTIHYINVLELIQELQKHKLGEYNALLIEPCPSRDYKKLTLAHEGHPAPVPGNKILI